MGSPVSTFTYLPGSLKSLLQGGLRFDASEEYLEFRFRVLNAVMITGVLFTAIFILIDWAGLNSLGHGQLLATEINCALTAGLVFMLRGRKERFGLVAVLFVAINYATFLSALLLVVNDELRVIWSRMRQTMAELREMAEKDALTGLLNPRTYYDVTNRMIWLAHRTSSPYALLFIDLDHFKLINDCFGHETGDTVLATVARTLHGHIRQSDVLGRIGGEEFSVFLPDTTPEGAKLLAEKLRAAVEAIDHSSVGTELLKTSASIGIALKQPADQTIADIQRRADRAMYQAKFAGRNRVVVESC